MYYEKYFVTLSFYRFESTSDFLVNRSTLNRSTQSPYDSECQIVPVSANITRLQLIPSGSDDCAFPEVREGASERT